MASCALSRALTIAGSDSGGGAGIQADLKTFTVMGVFGTSALTAVTAQNTLGVAGVYPLTPEQVGAQLDAVLADIGTDAAKTGMLFDVPIIEVVADRIRRFGVKNLVVDPVMIAKGGHPLLLPRAQQALSHLLLPLAAVVTPNLPEAEALTGRSITSRADMEAAGQALLQLGAGAAVVKGGHLEGLPADDVLVTPAGAVWLRSERLETRHTHGTGCTFSAAIAAGLARGLGLTAAVQQAKAFITLAIRRAPGIGAGHGPTNHLAWLEERP
jgi:hydroxymethylpyrimidine/phosphomethylpyrimidine kinase